MSRRKGNRGADPASQLRYRLQIESIDMEARGVARHEGKVVFVRGALAGEQVIARQVRSKPSFDVAETEVLERGSAQRVTPVCAHFGMCGGCSMQHLHPAAQLAVKQRALEDQLLRIGKVKADFVLRPIAGPAWGYRLRARLSVRHVVKKGGVLVGFHERGSGFVADMRECHVLPPIMSALLLPLRELIGALSIRDRMPQIEVAIGAVPAQTDSQPCIALVFRTMDPPSAQDRELLRSFSERPGVEIWLQPKGPDDISLLAYGGQFALSDAQSRLAYELPEFGIRMPYRPTDFTQVNHAINAVLVGRAVRLLGALESDRVADLFCGLGNFSLALARSAAEVVGIEGSTALTQRACENAAINGLSQKTRFISSNLFEMSAQSWQALGSFDRVLIDPPRDGALALVQALIESDGKPVRIVYVSCNPATLARDAQVLTESGAYRLRAAGAINMFPQTSHVESIAVFDRLA